MGWSLGLTAGPGGYGSAVSLQPGGVHLIGVFPTADLAVTAGALAAPDEPPSRVVLVHPSGVSASELGRHIGEIVLAGIDADDMELRSDAEVLVAVTGNRVLLIDADRDLIAGHPGKTAPFDPARLAELVAQDPFGTTVALTGHPEVRDHYHVAAREYAPMLVERPALAALALAHPTTSALVSTPRTAGSLAGSGVAVSSGAVMLTIFVAVVVLLALLFV